MRNHTQKALLFIEPVSSSSKLILKAQEKRYDPLIISANFNQQPLPNEVINTSLTIFQINIKDHRAVLDLVEKISQKFHVDGVIPGAEQYTSLTNQVAIYLKKPGLTEEAISQIQRKDALYDCLKTHHIPLLSYERVITPEKLKAAIQHVGLPCVLKSTRNISSATIKIANTLEEALQIFEAIMHQEEEYKISEDIAFQPSVLIQEYMEGTIYSVEGFLNNKLVSIVSVTEKILSPELDLTPIGYIVRSENEKLLIHVESYLKQVLSALKLNHGPFQADIKLSEKGPLLTEIFIGFPKSQISTLIGHATGIDYYDNVLKFFSNQPLYLQKTKRLNAGVAFLHTHNTLEACLENPHVTEIETYDKEEKLNSSIKQKLGHAFFLHKDYEILKQQFVTLLPHSR
ncbi:MAG: ATP-grasp domain-containing protein [Proteobacteria bacterium]|nr:ATP-grasp domain-containing protein [Pseudomonadota bacterium]